MTIPTFRRAAAMLLSLALFAPRVATSFPSQPLTGVTVNDTTKRQAGAILFTSTEDITYIINENGDTLRTLTSPISNTTLAFVRPIINGNLLARLRVPVGKPESLLEMKFDGTPVWSYVPVGYHLHHDHLRLVNGNTVALCDRHFTVPEISAQQLQDDCVIEVDNAGNVVWSWQTAQHFTQLGLSDAAKALIAEAGGDWAHANAVDVIPPNAPIDDPRFVPGNVLVSYRHLNLVIVIDKPTGNVVATFPNMTVGQHNIQMIPMDLPGGGHFLVFNNGYTDPNNNPWPAATNGSPELDHSTVIEFDPRDPTHPVWTYDATKSGRPAWWFFSSFISSVQRLPNGDTFICEGMNGRVFEVTPDGEIVWEFVNPHEAVRMGQKSPQLFRAYKIAAP
jgi:hypothetical protein